MLAGEVRSGYYGNLSINQATLQGLIGRVQMAPDRGKRSEHPKR